MNIARYIKLLGIASGIAASFSACTNLDETVYDQVMSANYYNTKQDIINAVFRPFEHMYCCIYIRHYSEEMPGDQMITPTRGTWWYDGGAWEQFHRHQYDDLSQSRWTGEWSNYYVGISQCNLVLDDLASLNPADFGLTDDEFDAFKAQLRCMRAYGYERLLNAYRNCILTTTSDPSVNELPENRKQVEPQVMFDFIESELRDFCMVALPDKKGTAGNGTQQGQFTKAAAAGLLVRLYLNAEVWIGKPMWQECIDLCERIRSGEFGYYAVGENWYEPFDWNNETSNEVVFAFPGSYGTVTWHMQNTYRTIYGRSMPYGCQYYLGIEGDGARNPEYALSPSYDNSNPRQLFDYKLGMVTQKFAKYPGDVRYAQYVNTSNNTRTGMFFLEGKIPNSSVSGGYAKNPDNQYVIYLRDQVGRFEGNAEAGYISNPAYKESIMGNGDFNSGLYCMKYPYYPYSGGYFNESDYAEIRLPEIIYSQAECLLRLGKTSEAATLLNSVRRRNYTDFNANIAYEPEGLVKLDLDEMLDEWGREFLNESRRRTDLIRFGRFQDAWWDKPQDADKHYELFPIPRTQLEQNPYLKQNPGYQDVDR